MSKDSYIRIRVSRAQKEAIKTVADYFGLSMTDLIIRALISYEEEVHLNVQERSRTT